jgi:antitoxin (DNA-binding transcriptional repressor) of toxin-antitoxin stability system
MLALTVEVKEAQDRLQELLAKVAEGTEIILTDGDRPFARISPIPASSATRVPDLHPGAFQPSDDFNDPLPDEFWLDKECGCCSTHMLSCGGARENITGLAPAFLASRGSDHTASRA